MARGKQTSCVMCCTVEVFLIALLWNRDILQLISLFYFLQLLSGSANFKMWGLLEIDSANTSQLAYLKFDQSCPCRCIVRCAVWFCFFIH